MNALDDVKLEVRPVYPSVRNTGETIKARLTPERRKKLAAILTASGHTTSSFIHFAIDETYKQLIEEKN